MYVELKNINKVFGDYKASNNVNFGIEKGKLVALLGPSGSGKTTILRMIAGLEHPDSGDIIIDGKVVNDIPASKRGIGFVFQNYALFRYMTVYDNIAFGLRVQKVSKKKIDERVKELIKLIGLEGLDNRFPSQLSGGQRQRVAFARALAPNPQLLLLDEPFAAIDAKVRQELRSWLKEMIEKLGVTSIFVTHDQDEAIEVADEIIITNKGRVEQKGSPVEIYQNPQTAFAASFFGQTSLIENYTSFSTFDEIEKAHPDVFNILLQVLDDGRITDSQGRTVDFKNTIIILTSNLGSSFILDGIQPDNTISEEAREQVSNLLKSQFRPEFLNRIDEIVFYKPLAKTEITSIVDLMLHSLENRLADKQLKLEVTPSAKDFIIDSGYDPVYGARPLKRFIQSHIETLVGRMIIAEDLAPDTTIVVDYDGNKLVASSK